MTPVRLIAVTTVVVANPIAHVIRADDYVTYASWHPINIGVAASLLVLAFLWARFLRAEDLRVSLQPVWPLSLLALVACASAPGVRSLSWGAHLFLLTAATVVVARRIDLDTLRRGVRDGVVVLLLMSLVFVFFVPQYGLTQGALYGGAWRGVFASKNHLGLIAAMAVVLGVLTRAHVGVLLLGAVTLWGTRSGTGMLVALVGVVVAAGYKRPLLLAGLFVLCVATLFARERSFTGRTVVWRHVIELIAQKPLLGHGLRAYFEEGRDETVLQAEMNAATRAGGREVKPMYEPKWRVSHAHNGFLQTALDLGIVVTALLVAWMLRRTIDARDPATWAIFAALCAHNLTEVSLVRTWHPEALLWHLAVVHSCASRS